MGLIQGLLSGQHGGKDAQSIVEDRRLGGGVQCTVNQSRGQLTLMQEMWGL
jgi:hypothetical protein